MAWTANLEAIYDRLRAITPGEWKTLEVTNDGSTWELSANGAPLPYTGANALFIERASDDIASLAAEIEELREEVEYLRTALGGMWSQQNATTEGVNDLVRLMGGDSDHGNFSLADKLVKQLIQRSKDQEAAIRAALSKPKSDEAIQTLSAVLQKYNRR